MSGYLYTEKQPTEKCGLCDGEASAEFCDVGVGMVQISPFHCGDCGALLSPLRKDGTCADGWVPSPSASERGESVTGYYITAAGAVIEMTFEEGHQEFNERTGKSTSQRLSEGWVRITNLEGFAIDLPPFMSQKTKRSLVRLTKDIFAHGLWGDPFVLRHGFERGGEMNRIELMSHISKLPDAPARVPQGVQPGSI